MIDGSILAAVSGGADSVAMLHMLLNSPPGRGGREADGVVQCMVTAAHYNHGLRDSADGDEDFVRSLCAEWGVPFVSERGEVSKGTGVEERAREMRYAFLERVRAERGLGRIATAHTADDNAETVLLNLTRGSGLHGLCGIPHERGAIIRPLLHFSRAEVIRYLTERNIPWREDESNADTVYRRNYIRHTVIPSLKEVNPSLTDAVIRLTASLSEDEEYLTELARQELLPSATEGEGFSAKRLTELPRPIAARVCRLLYMKESLYPPERVHIDAMLDIAKGGNGRRRHLAGNLTVEKRSGKINILFTKG